MAYTRFSGKQYRKSDWGRIPPSMTYIMGSFHALECLSCRLLPRETTEEYFDNLQKTRDEINARWKADGRKYMIAPVDRSIKFAGYDSFSTNSRRDMLKHIRRHRKAGHAVPRAAWRRLVREIRTQGDEY